MLQKFFFAEEMLCASKEEHEALFGDAGDFDSDDTDDLADELEMAGLLTEFQIICDIIY